MQSDIDLVVEGLGPGREHFAALAQLQDNYFQLPLGVDDDEEEA